MESVIARFEEERAQLLERAEAAAADSWRLRQELAAARDRGSELAAELGAIRETARRREGALMQVLFACCNFMHAGVGVGGVLVPQ
jgi:hypothetical protein